MISCKKATELISKSMEEPLTLKEELALKIHNFICEFCEQFRKQLLVMRAALKGSPAEDLESRDSCNIGLSKDAKQRLKDRLQDKQ